MEFVVLILWWAIPVAVISYLFQVAKTIVLGMRSMNSHLERITAAVEQLAEAERRAHFIAREPAFGVTLLGRRPRDLGLPR